MAKDVGAKQVIVASCAPPIRYSNVYGIDMPSRTELVAHERSEDEIARAIGADVVIFQTLPDLIDSVKKWNPHGLDRFDCSVFDGVYVTGHVGEGYLNHLEKLRSDNAKIKQASLGFVTPLANGVTGPNGVMNGHAIGGKETQSPYQEVLQLPEVSDGCSGPLNGADETVGLHNSWTLMGKEKNQLIVS